MKRGIWAAAWALSLTIGAGFAIAEDVVPGDEMLGQWYTADNASKVVVFKENGKYYGTIVWLAEPNYPPEEPDGDAGKPKRDKNNPERSGRKKPIIGLQVLKGFVFDAADQSWSGGTIYDPENGKVYKCVVRMQTDEKGIDGKSLHVRGYVGVPQLGRTTIWYRVPPEELVKLEAPKK